MKQPGRKSAVNIGLAPFMTAKQSKLIPPAYLSKAARAEFIDVIANCNVKHFTKADTPLLSSYVMATLMTRATANDPEQFNVFERAARLQSALAMRLRLTPQSRLEAKTVARFKDASAAGPFPWESKEEN